jgi:hypothetical protein
VMFIGKYIPKTGAEDEVQVNRARIPARH